MAFRDVNGCRVEVKMRGEPECAEERMKFVKENQISKRWKTMKITVDFENGMQVTLKTENVQLVDNHGKDTVLTFKTEHTLVPIMFFKSLLATPVELGLRNAALAAAAKAASEKKPAPGAPAATTETGTDKELLKKALDESKPGETVTAGPAGSATSDFTLDGR